MRKELKQKLEEITNMFTDEEIASMTPEEKEQVAVAIARLQERIKILGKILSILINIGCKTTYFVSYHLHNYYSECDLLLIEE